MAYLTHAMRQKMAADRLEERPGTDLARMRVLDRQFAERALAERNILYPVLSDRNADDAIAFQEKHINDLRDSHAEYQACLARVRERKQ